MPKIIFVSGLEDIEVVEAVAQAVAGASVKPWQRALKKGDYFVRFVDSFAFYSEVLESSSGDFCFTKSYSILCEEGELGDVHLSEVHRKISRAQFEAFKARGWAGDADTIRDFLASN